MSKRAAGEWKGRGEERGREEGESEEGCQEKQAYTLMHP
jgi:predicted transposase YdaD